MNKFKNRKTITYGSLLIICMHIGALGAETIEGKVIGVMDGDTIRIIDANQRQVKVRLAAIDAPEKDQPYGKASKKSLSRFIYKQSVRVEWTNEHYSYDRIVGKVSLQGEDVGLRQLNQGMAWYYKRFAHEQAADDRERYTLAERGAQANKLGLWRDNNPMAPWDWREKQRESTKKTQDAFHEKWLYRNWQFR